MRAIFGLKRTIIRSKLSFKSLLILFDSSITLYGAPIWAPTSTINKSINKQLNTSNTQNFIPKVSRAYSEKVHISYLKWALGVHKKASNIGVWEGTDRYPLIYQSLRLALNYYKRLQNLPDSTFAHAAMKEQKAMKLPWYQNLEPLMKLDDIFHLDHVKAHRVIKSKGNADSIEPRWELNRNNINLTNKLLQQENVRPLPSEKFRAKKVINKLSNKFTQCWQFEKYVSSKIIISRLSKAKICQRHLDSSKGFPHRYSTTKLRISAQGLKIKIGRYSNTSREDKKCHWCHTSMGINVIEDERHVLFNCNLYDGLRTKVIARLNSAPEISSNINNQNNYIPLTSHH